MPYTHERQVVRFLREMAERELERLYVEGLLERKAGGPEDGDQARSDRLMQLVVAEIDKRFLEGPREGDWR
jgi:hypothetical protein